MILRVLLTAVLATGIAAAQRGGEMGGEMGGAGGGRGGEGVLGNFAGGRIPPKSKFDQFADKLKLNKDQRTEAQSIVDDARKETVPIQQQMFAARQDMAGAMVTGAPDQQVDELIKNYAPLSAKFAEIETKAFGKVFALLKPNQQSKAAQCFPLLAEIFEQPAMGGRGRGRGER